ncbi:hypothetical protein ACFPRL_07040 [Pseudoclavibacter helvolus]
MGAAADRSRGDCTQQRYRPKVTRWLPIVFAPRGRVRISPTGFRGVVVEPDFLP